MPKTPFGVFIGRFQPPHLAHIESLRRGLELFENLIVVIGSCRVYPNIKNPFTFTERNELIRASLSNAENARITLLENLDEPEREEVWRQSVIASVRSITGNASVGLLCHIKDASGYYQKSFPEWTVHDSGVDNNPLNATDVRSALFENNPVWHEMVSPGVKAWLERWTQSPSFARLQREHRALQAWKLEAAKVQYPIIGVVVDTTVTCDGHVLLIERKGPLGDGALALPGGFLEPEEWPEDAAKRELQEETGLQIAQPATASKAFVWPGRSLGRRVISHGFHFDLNGPLPTVQAADDAAKAFWIPIDQALAVPEKFFNDHWFMLRWFVKGF